MLFRFAALSSVHFATVVTSFLVLMDNFIYLLQDAIEECRKLCGGHGYLCSSGLPELFAVYVPSCTYEGDNVVLLLQVFLLISILITPCICY